MKLAVLYPSPFFSPVEVDAAAVSLAIAVAKARVDRVDAVEGCFLEA